MGGGEQKPLTPRARESRDFVRNLVWKFRGGTGEVKSLTVKSLMPVSYTHLDVYKRQVSPNLVTFTKNQQLAFGLH